MTKQERLEEYRRGREAAIKELERADRIDRIVEEQFSGRNVVPKQECPPVSVGVIGKIVSAVIVAVSIAFTILKKTIYPERGSGDV